MDQAIRELAKFIFESDLIEGLGGGAEDLRELENGIENRLEEYKVNSSFGQGHIGAMIMLESLARQASNGRTDKELICKIQELIVGEQGEKYGGETIPSEWVGSYRTVDVGVGPDFCPTPDRVPGLMEDLLTKFSWWQRNARFQPSDANVRYAADFHYNFLKIHPFVDGNGRTARALAYYHLRYAILKPFVFTSHDKHLYYRCFDHESSQMMREYFETKMAYGMQVLVFNYNLGLTPF